MSSRDHPGAEATHLESAMSRYLVLSKQGEILTINELDRASDVNEPLGLIAHAWERTAESGEVVCREFITDTGMLVRGDQIVEERGVSTAVSLPHRVATPDEIVRLAEGTAGSGILERSQLSQRRREYLINEADRIADEFNRISRLIVTEYWIGWYSAEGIPMGLDGVYELDFATESNPELSDAIVRDYRTRLVDQTRLSRDQVETLLPIVPDTIPVKVDVFADGQQIL